MKKWLHKILRVITIFVLMSALVVGTCFGADEPTPTPIYTDEWYRDFLVNSIENVADDMADQIREYLDWFDKTNEHFHRDPDAPDASQPHPVSPSVTPAPSNITYRFLPEYNQANNFAWTTYYSDTQYYVSANSKTFVYDVINIEGTPYSTANAIYLYFVSGANRYGAVAQYVTYQDGNHWRGVLVGYNYTGVKIVFRMPSISVQVSGDGDYSLPIVWRQSVNEPFMMGTVSGGKRVTPFAGNNDDLFTFDVEQNAPFVIPLWDFYGDGVPAEPTPSPAPHNPQNVPYIAPPNPMNYYEGDTFNEIQYNYDNRVWETINNYNNNVLTDPNYQLGSMGGDDIVPIDKLKVGIIAFPFALIEQLENAIIGGYSSKFEFTVDAISFRGAEIFPYTHIELDPVALFGNWFVTMQYIFVSLLGFALIMTAFRHITSLGGESE